MGASSPRVEGCLEGFGAVADLFRALADNLVQGPTGHWSRKSSAMPWNRADIQVLHDDDASGGDEAFACCSWDKGNSGAGQIGRDDGSGQGVLGQRRPDTRSPVLDNNDSRFRLCGSVHGPAKGEKGTFPEPSAPLRECA
ncbi:hypothetical protein O9K51_08920 [Purpureocillium lavendulum]|uniref:Uncharacterized protein n=1 Tax=Purpureocillium lavendulum TaxID=1247861 RepID=A0AB34FFW1_9HYPO|nr:hypothetical protein O9K51_08920 [Purpureocillium lavendulum]